MTCPGSRRSRGSDGCSTVVVTDALGNDAPVPRLRVLIAAAQAATRLLETGELETRISTLEVALEDRLAELEEVEAPWTAPDA